ncbi:MAG TPA: NAD(P)H-hydrate dehydratase [Bacilli bacterium]
MYLVTAEEMRRLDRHTIDRIGIPGHTLMELAGKAVADHIADRYATGRWLILAGKGNNGGDGLVAARHLLERGFHADVLFAADPGALTGDIAEQIRIAAHFPLGMSTFAAGQTDWRSYNGVVDALLGTGSKGAPRKQYAAMIEEANASGLPIVAVDIPSGLDADTGQTFTPCISARHTVTFAFMKRGLAVYPGKAAAGEVIVAPIGIPAHLAEEHGISVFLATETILKERLAIRPDWPRLPDTHKGTYGHVLIAAGSGTMSGAGQLCAKAALRAGSGLVTWLTPQRVADRAAGSIPEVMTVPLPDNGLGQWSYDSLETILALVPRKNALVVGPGLGRFAQDVDWLKRIWEETGIPLVLDADALNILADAKQFTEWPKRSAPVILTPHPGEMARLTGKTTAEVQQDRIECAKKYAREHGITIVLKGARTVTTAPDGSVYVNTTGNPGMATAGAGDVLSGVIGSLLAQGYSATQAAVAGVYLHGAAGDRALATRAFSYSLIAGDIVENL